ncbi:MAG: hypothetical protein Q7T70_04985 [Polaromonas sp.]|nr:hypothetical protein [Polaromonas sp.]
MMRNVDKEFAEWTGGIHDYPVRRIMGCQILKCSASKTDPSYANSNINSQYIVGNQGSYDLGLGQLPTGKTYNQLVTGNIHNDPVGAAVAGAGMVGLGYLSGGAGAAVGMKVFGAGVGAIANYAFQPSGQPTNWIDVGIATGKGFLTSGMGFGSSVVTNTGGSLSTRASRERTPMREWGLWLAAQYWATDWALVCRRAYRKWSTRRPGITHCGSIWIGDLEAEYAERPSRDGW